MKVNHKNSLKYKIHNNITVIIIISIMITFISVVGMQIYVAVNDFNISAQLELSELTARLDANQKEIDTLQDEIEAELFSNASSLATIFDLEPEYMFDHDFLKQMITETRIDEIHIFDTNGVIIAGSVTEYLGYNFESGAQIAYFKPMLHDKSLQLVQPITPNTAAGEPMQYAMIWDRSGEYLIQVGLSPEKVISKLEKNDLSYVLEFMNTDKRLSFLAIDRKDRNLIADTSNRSIGSFVKSKNFSSQFYDSDPCEKGNMMLDGLLYYYYGVSYNDIILCIFETSSSIYQDVLFNTLVSMSLVLCIGITLRFFIMKTLNKLFILPIESFIDCLEKIRKGKMQTRVQENSTYELALLSEHMNSMVDSVVSRSNQIAYIFEQADVPIVIFEINHASKKVHFTGDLCMLLDIDEKEKKLLKDVVYFNQMIDNMKKSPVPESLNTYQCLYNPSKYISTNRYDDGSKTWGVLMDATKATANKLQILEERDHDHLTGLYTRRAFFERATHIIERLNPSTYYAVLVLDLDNLKVVNDTIGHAFGDLFIKRAADTLLQIKHPNTLVSRLGGDEFAAIIYDVESSEKLQSIIHEFDEHIKTVTLSRPDGQVAPVRFSCGYVIASSSQILYRHFLRLADEAMYIGKHNGKGQFIEHVLKDEDFQQSNS